MATIYSVEFAHAEVPMSPGVFYTVPSGYVAVLRDVDAISPGTVGEILLSEAVANLNFGGLVPATLPSGVVVWTWRGRQVFSAGQEMQWGADFNDAFARACGYLLTAN